MKRARGRARKAPKDASRLDSLIADAIVDCCNESEAIAGFYNVIEDNLQVPFTTEVLGMEVTVEGIDLTDAEEIVARCRRGRFRQAVPVLHLPLPKSLPTGVEWIEAYRRWVRGR